MENNEQVQEEQNTAPSADETEIDNSQEETRDWKAEALKYKAIAERKDKKLQKQSEEDSEQPLKNNNTEQSVVSRDEVIFFAKGGNEEDLITAKKIANLEGISILAAMEDDFYKSKVAQRQAAQQARNNQLGASGGSGSTSGHQEKPISKMTAEEHKAYVAKRIPGLR